MIKIECTASSSGRQPNFVALNRGRHLCLAGRPSRWALAHILVVQTITAINKMNLVLYVLLQTLCFKDINTASINKTIKQHRTT